MCTVQVSSCYVCCSIPLHTSILFLLLNVFPCSTYLLRDIFLNLLFPFIYIITSCSLQPLLPQYHAHPLQARPALTVDALRTVTHSGIKVSCTLEEMPEYNHLSEGGKVAILPIGLPVDRLVIFHGEILKTCKSEIQLQGRFKRLTYFLFFKIMQRLLTK